MAKLNLPFLNCRHLDALIAEVITTRTEISIQMQRKSARNKLIFEEEKERLKEYEEVPVRHGPLSDSASVNNFTESPEALSLQDVLKGFARGEL